VFYKEYSKEKAAGTFTPPSIPNFEAIIPAAGNDDTGTATGDSGDTAAGDSGDSAAGDSGDSAAGDSGDSATTDPTTDGEDTSTNTNPIDKASTTGNKGPNGLVPGQDTS
jgi:hypothetical protein